MKHLISYIKQLATSEQIRANEKHGTFHSDHEGYAVLLEEVLEADYEMKQVTNNTEALKWAVFTDDAEGARDTASRIKERAILLAAEATQVASVAQRIIDGQAIRMEGAD